jgi:hypothetical protein
VVYLALVFLMLEIIFRQVLSLPFPNGAVFQAFDFDPRFDLGIRL